MELKRWSECSKVKNLNNPKYWQMCMLSLLFPLPGWCWVQQEIKEKLNIDTEEGDFLKSVLFCLFGLALNRDKIRKRVGWKSKFPLDLCLFAFCGHCVMFNDITVAFEVFGTREKSLSVSRSSCIEHEYCCNPKVFLPCFFMFVFPIPGYCALQAYTVNASNSDNSVEGALLRAALLGPFGFAWNRHLIRSDRGYGDAYCEDCVLYTLGCCQCLISQEFTEVKVGKQN